MHYYSVSFNYYRHKTAVEQGEIRIKAFQDYNLPDDLEKLKKDTADPDRLGAHSIILFNIIYEVEKLFAERDIEFAHAYAYPDGSWHMWVRSWLSKYCVDSLLNKLISEWRLSCTVDTEDGSRIPGGDFRAIKERMDTNCEQRKAQI